MLVLLVASLRRSYQTTPTSPTSFTATLGSNWSVAPPPPPICIMGLHVAPSLVERLKKTSELSGVPAGSLPHTTYRLPSLGPPEESVAIHAWWSIRMFPVSVGRLLFMPHATMVS